MKLLDLFCGAGGAAVGYHRAGFTEIVGVDIKAQPRYPFAFVQADALEYVREHGREFDAIHASPPCQAYSSMKSLKNSRSHPDLVPPAREALAALAAPWVIENVPGAPMRNFIILCGSMFALRSHGNRYLRRHRLFECSHVILQPYCRHNGVAVGVYGHGQAGHLGQRMTTAKAPEARLLMGMDWATRDGMSQAIPPAYTEFIGRQLVQAIANPTADGRPRISPLRDESRQNSGGHAPVEIGLTGAF